MLSRRYLIVLGLAAVGALSTVYLRITGNSYMVKNENEKMFSLESRYPLPKMDIFKFPREEWPMCENPLGNLTAGRWIRKVSLIKDKYSDEYVKLVKLEEAVSKHTEIYRLQRGIYKTPFRDDLKCGYKNYATPTSSDWEPSGSWCDAKTKKSCCTDETDGVCVDPKHLNDCKCPRCVDMTKLSHAEVSQWNPSDTRCRRQNFTASAACDVMEKFNEVYFVGDSIMRKIYRAFLLTLTSDVNTGAQYEHFTPEMMKLCVGQEQFFWSNCKSLGENLEGLIHKRQLCGGKGTTAFAIESRTFYSMEYAKDFLNFVKSLSGKEGSVIFLSVGLHMQCDARKVIEYYLHPAVQYSEAYVYNQLAQNHSIQVQKWPLIIFIPPDTHGLLKQWKYFQRQGRQALMNYKMEMKRYCDDRNIPFIDFGELTTGVHSYDGAHYGIAVNLMKVQIILNYMNAIKL